MRTPWADRELAAGFLLSRARARVGRRSRDTRILHDSRTRELRDLGTPGTLRTSRTSRTPEPANLVNSVNRIVRDARMCPRGLDRILADRRQVTTNSSCGMCGRLTIDSLRADRPAAHCRDWTIARASSPSMPDRLRAAQPVFEETGGLHAAGLFTADGRLDGSAEDVGRHNAVDKVDRAHADARSASVVGLALFVSGRTSFEIVQKALFARHSRRGLGVGAFEPRDRARRRRGHHARRLRQRDERFNIYTHPERIE